MLGPSGCGKTTLLSCLSGEVHSLESRVLELARLRSSPGMQRGRKFFFAERMESHGAQVTKTKWTGSIYLNRPSVSILSRVLVRAMLQHLLQAEDCEKEASKNCQPFRPVSESTTYALLNGAAARSRRSGMCGKTMPSIQS